MQRQQPSDGWQHSSANGWQQGRAGVLAANERVATGVATLGRVVGAATGAAEVVPMLLGGAVGARAVVVQQVGGGGELAAEVGSGEVCVAQGEGGVGVGRQQLRQQGREGQLGGSCSEGGRG